jgi:hypothetical protein
MFSESKWGGSRTCPGKVVTGLWIGMFALSLLGGIVGGLTD